MSRFIAHITPRDGICRRLALISFDIEDARLEASRLASALFGRGFTFIVRADP